MGIGVRGGVALYEGNDFSSKKIRAWGNVLGESYLTNQFSLETALNLGQIAGENGSNFRSTLTGLSLLGRLALTPSESFRPYVAGGVEYLGVDPKDGIAALVIGQVRAVRREHRRHDAARRPDGAD